MKIETNLSEPTTKQSRGLQIKYKIMTKDKN